MSGGLPRRKPLDKWISEALNDRDKDGKCTLLSLVHMVGVQYSEVHSVKIGTGHDAKALADLFREKATAYAQDMPGPQTFNVLAFYGGRSEPEAKQPFLIQPPADPNAGLSTEAPTEQGKTAQTMRQAEMVFQQAYKKQQHLDEYASRTIETQAHQINRLIGENMAMFESVKKLLMEQAQLAHDKTMEELRMKKAAEERALLYKFAPALINSIAGREVFPQATADSALIDTIAEHINEEQVALLDMALPAQVAGPLKERLLSYLEKKKQEQEAIAALPVPKVKPEDDIAGGGTALTEGKEAAE